MKSTRKWCAWARAMKRASHPSVATAGAGDPSLNRVRSSCGHKAAARAGEMLDCAEESGSLNPSSSRARPDPLAARSERMTDGVTEPEPQIIGTHGGPPPPAGAVADQS